MNSQSQIVEKVKRLLALSQSSNINEAANAAAIANKYIVQYRLRQADLIEQSQGTVQPDPIVDDPEPMYMSARVIPWKLQLASVLAQHYGCAIWNDKEDRRVNGRGTSRFRLVGRSVDVNFTKQMFAWLVNEIQRHADVECLGMGHPTHASYCKGAVKGIENLLGETRASQLNVANQASRTKAIARMDNRFQEAQDYLYSQHHMVRPAIPKPRFDPKAFERGFDVGNFIGKSVR